MRHARPPLSDERYLAGDASYRRYARARTPEGNTVILVRYPRDRPGEFRRDLEVRRWLAEKGLRVPDLLWVDAEEREAVLEDFGPHDAARVLAALGPEERLVQVLDLVRPLEVLSRLDPAELPPWNVPLSGSRLREELIPFGTWFAGELIGRRLSPASEDWLGTLVRWVDRHPKRVCHRDYHLNNLFFLPEGDVGIIDFQDVLVGPDTYDASSFLGDRDLPTLLAPRERARWLEAWAEATAADPGWEGRAAETEAHRGLKVLGTFARLALSRGERRYLQWVPPLAARMAPLVESLGAPAEMVELLLDCPLEGLDHVG